MRCWLSHFHIDGDDAYDDDDVDDDDGGGGVGGSG